MSNIERISIRRLLKLLLGPVFFVFLWQLNPFELENIAASALGVAVWMILWWVTEAVPMAVTALLPMLLFPLLGVQKLETTALSYGNQVIFLFMGGFMIGMAIEKWNLHRRMALHIVRFTGTSPNRVVLGFMLATHVLSMWLSNTATAMMMMPIAQSVSALMLDRFGDSKSMRNFSLTLFLGVGYAASIGGVSTIIGTPPNVVLSSYLQKTYDYSLSFAEWMLFAAPLALLLLLMGYAILLLVFPNRMKADSGSADIIRTQLLELGKMTQMEYRVTFVFCLIALLWVLRTFINDLFPDLNLDDTQIALLGMLLLFLIPAGKKEKSTLLQWKDTRKMEWGVLLLFGGGLALADGLKTTGIISVLAGQIENMGSGQTFLLLALLTVSGLFLTEVMSNVALVTVYVPVVCALALGMGESPLMFAIPVTIAASCAFMLPIATPPNAIVFASGSITVKQMAKAGFLLNVVSFILIFFAAWLLIPLIFTGLQPADLPVSHQPTAQ